jgi:hypothetical protein
MDKAHWSNERRLSILGHPVVRIPASAKKYNRFLEWWLTIGKLNPEDPQGWSGISGPGVVKNRVEAISPEEWDVLPKSERDLIQTWADSLPIGVFYD